MTKNMIFYYMKKHKFYNMGIFLVTLIQDLILIGATFATMKSARLVMEGDINLVLQYMMLLVVLFLAVQFIFFLKEILIGKAIKLMNQDMRDDLNTKSFCANGEILSKPDIGECLSWYIYDIKEAEEQGYQTIYEAFDYLIKLIIGCVSLAAIKIELLVCTLVVSGAVFLLSRFMEGDVEANSNKVSRELGRFTDVIKEQISGYKVLKGFGYISRFFSNIEDATQSLESERYHFVKSKEKANMKLNMLNSVGNFINMIVLFGMCALKIIPAEIFFGGGNLTSQVKDSLMGLAQCRIYLAGSRPYFDKMKEINKEVHKEEKEALKEVKDSIYVGGLNFAYHEKRILKDLNLEFKIGGKYAIVGKSGCGKSTLLKILLGQLKGYEGEILFDGKDARQYDPDSFSNIVAYIEQNVFLYNTSIRNNITLGQAFSDEELEQALKKSALMKDLPSFSMGLDTNVGENGKNISGGQKQRIAIARALIFNRSILFVDEGTSALDRENASVIENSLLECQDLTLLLISHHLSEEKMNAFTKVYHLSETKERSLCGNI